MQPAEARIDVPNRAFVRRPNGDLVGPKFTIPKGDFARFLGYRTATLAEQKNPSQVPAGRVLQLTLQEQFNTLGKQAITRATAYKSLASFQFKHRNHAQASSMSVKHGVDTLDHINQLNGASNMQYLELQYVMQMAHMRSSTVSDLMKARHESTRRAIQDVK